jgi:hypothetical protein
MDNLKIKLLLPFKVLALVGIGIPLALVVGNIFLLYCLMKGVYAITVSFIVGAFYPRTPRSN